MMSLLCGFPCGQVTPSRPLPYSLPLHLHHILHLQTWLALRQVRRQRRKGEKVIGRRQRRRKTHAFHTPHAFSLLFFSLSSLSPFSHHALCFFIFFPDVLIYYRHIAWQLYADAASPSDCSFRFSTCGGFLLSLSFSFALFRSLSLCASAADSHAHFSFPITEKAKDAASAARAGPVKDTKKKIRTSPTFKRYVLVQPR